MSKSGSSITYGYNADGKRISKTVNGTTYNYAYLGDALTDLSWGSNRMHFTYDSLGPASVTYNGVKYFYLKNAQGDVTGLVNASGAQVVSYTYDPWGAPLSTGGTMAATLGAANPLRYRGYVYDTETGLYYLSSRYYNPVWGRFINADSLIVDCGANTQNLFVYCENNPVRYVDSSGHSAVLAATGIVALAVVLFTGIYCIVTNSGFQQAVRNAIANAYNKTQSFVSGIKETLCASISSALEQMSNACAKRADARIRAAVKENSKNRFWSANVRRGYVDIGRPLTFNQAVAYVASGRSVFAVTEYEAKAVARAAGGNAGRNNIPLYPEIDSGKAGVPGYYYHFHTYNRSGGHVYYIFP